MPQRLSPANRWRSVNKQRTNDHMDWCADPRTHELVEVALAEYVCKLDSATATDAAANHFKLAGARGLIETLLNLGELPTPPKQKLEPQLEKT
jgi:hypothetical protein